MNRLVHRTKTATNGTVTGKTDSLSWEPIAGSVRNCSRIRLTPVSLVVERSAGTDILKNGGRFRVRESEPLYGVNSDTPSKPRATSYCLPGSPLRSGNQFPDHAGWELIGESLVQTVAAVD